LTHWFVFILDISNPTSPTQIGTYDPVHLTFDITADDNYIYTLEYHIFSYFTSLKIYNHAGQRILNGMLEIPGVRLPKDGNYVYVSGVESGSSQENGLRIVDVSDKTNLTQVGFFILLDRPPM